MSTQVDVFGEAQWPGVSEKGKERDEDGER